MNDNQFNILKPILINENQYFYIPLDFNISGVQMWQGWLLNDLMLICLNLDQDQKNIIDKLANFVARNGSKFEEMTKQKQKGNPKFAFLFSGEFYNYYRWKVSFEIGKALFDYL